MALSIKHFWRSAKFEKYLDKIALVKQLDSNIATLFA
jgi:hypothetical protein